MANGDITKEIQYDKIEVLTASIGIRKATAIMEENADGSKTELSRNFHRHVLNPFNSVKADNGTWTHTATDISSEAAQVQAIANAAWTDAVKNAYKAMREAQEQ